MIHVANHMSGWCMTNDHTNCPGIFESSMESKTPAQWKCPCSCHKE